MTALEAVFWLALLGATYSYFIYPALLLLFAAPSGGRSGTADPPTWPRVSIIITAYNEQERIEEKLHNTLALDYPAELREVIVASDGSTDGTDAIVARMAGQGVQLVRPAERRGKEFAQAAAIVRATGEILVFSDVATTIPAAAIKAIARRMAEPGIGAVSSEDRFVSADGRLVGEGAYVRYEMWLRALESRLRGLVGLSGSFFAARREVCTGWDTDIPSDFNTALNCARRGLRAVSDTEVIGIYPDLKEGGHEYQRKLRTVIRGMAALARRAELLNPFRYGVIAWQVWSHKIMRWAVPWMLLVLFPVSAALAAGGELYRWMFWAQIIFYAVAAAGWLSAALRRHPLVRIPLFFLQVNAAIAHAAIAFLMGRRITRWEPSKR